MNIDHLSRACRAIFKRYFPSKKGQTLVESVIAVSLLSVGLLAIVSLINRSLSLNRTSAESYTATYLAAEGIEVVKNIVDSNAIKKLAWNAGLANGDYEVEYDSTSLSPNQNRFLDYDSSSNLYGYGVATPTGFKRMIRITLVGSEEIKVNSIVSWTTAGGGDFRVNLEDHFMNWRT